MATAAGLALDTKTARLAREFSGLIEREAARWAPPARQRLNAEGWRAADAYKDEGTEQAALAAVVDPPWRAYIDRVWLATVPRAGELVERWLLKAGPPDVFLQATVRWLRLNGAQHVQWITDTSRDEIGNQIRIGVSKGEGRDQIAARIVKHRRSISPERAQVIARTEVHAAANYGSLVAAGEVNVPMKKIWVARSGARPTHASASGQLRPLADDFTVGGYALAFPGDSSKGAPASITVNCRCVLSYEVERRPARPRRAA
jgi:Phage Mu protein F like protein